MTEEEIRKKIWALRWELRALENLLLAVRARKEFEIGEKVCFIIHKEHEDVFRQGILKEIYDEGMALISPMGAQPFHSISISINDLRKWESGDATEREEK